MPHDCCCPAWLKVQAANLAMVKNEVSGPLRSRNPSVSQRNRGQDSICGHDECDTRDQPSKSNHRTELQQLAGTATYHWSSKACLVIISAMYVSAECVSADHSWSFLRPKSRQQISCKAPPCCKEYVATLQRTDCDTNNMYKHTAATYISKLKRQCR